MSSVPPPTPEAQRAIDGDHLRLLGIFHLVVAGFSGMGLMFFGVYSAFVHAAFAHSPDRHPPDAAIIGAIMTVIGLLIALNLLLNLISGLCLLNRKARVFSIIVAGIDCVHIPLGTILGIFTLMVLLRPSVRDSYLS